MLIWIDAFCAKYPHIIEAFGALAPFFGTVFLAYIAYQQWQTNERKRRQELFEMRYELFSKIDEFIFNIIEITNKTCPDDKTLCLVEIRDNKVGELAKILNKNSFLLQKKDSDFLWSYLMNELFTKIINFDKLDKKEKNEKIEKLKEEIDNSFELIFEPYLRIEHEKPSITIWALTIEFIVYSYEFLTPKWLQNFLSKTKTVILNSFQNLTEKKQKPTEEVE